MRPSEATLAFLEHVGRTLGRDWQITLTLEIGRGTFTHLDEEPCLMEGTREEPNRQMRLEEK